MRRLRRTPTMRRMVAEHRLHVDDLVAPLFVKEGIDAPEPVPSMPGVLQHTQESLRKEVRALADLGIPAVMLFGVPARQGRAARRRTPPTGWCRSRSGRSATRSATVSCSWPTTVSTSTPTTGTAGCSRATARSTTTPRSSATRCIAVAQAGAGADVIAPIGDDGRPGRRHPRARSTAPGSRRSRSSRTRRSTPRRCTGRSATRPSVRRSSVTGAATRWTRATRGRRSSRSRSISTRAPTW